MSQRETEQHQGIVGVDQSKAPEIPQYALEQFRKLSEERGVDLDTYLNLLAEEEVFRCEVFERGGVFYKISREGDFEAELNLPHMFDGDAIHYDGPEAQHLIGVIDYDQRRYAIQRRRRRHGLTDHDEKM